MVFDVYRVGDKVQRCIEDLFAEKSDCEGFLYGLDIAVMLHKADIGSVVVRLWWLVEVVADQFCIRRDAEER